MDAKGLRHKVHAIGMDSKSVVEEAKGLKGIIHLFLTEECASKQACHRPHGAVILLIVQVA